MLLTSLRLFIKEKSPRVYARVRSLLFIFVYHYRVWRAKGFTKPQFKDLHFGGQSFQIALDPQNGFIDTYIYTSGVYEPDILTVIKDHLTAGACFVDIGANIGQHSLFAASIVGTGGTVVAFEPIPRLAAQLRSSIAQNHFAATCLIHELGCGAREETLFLAVNKQNIGGSTVQETAGVGTIPIHLVTADSKLAALPHVTLIKIDTEGYELEALYGLAETLKRHRPTLIIEYSPALWPSDTIKNGQALFALLREHSYRLYDLEVGHQEITNDTEWINRFTKLQTNLLCIAVHSS